MSSANHDVLVVEDDQLLNLVMAMELSQVSGLSVRSAANGYQALDLVRAKAPDLIILDVTLPGLNAFDVIDSLKEDGLFNTVPVIIHTSHDLSQEEQDRLTLGKTVFVTKTRTQEELADIVREVLGM